MTDEKEVIGKLLSEQDLNRFERFQIEEKDGTVGTLYTLKNKQSLLKHILLEYANK